MYILVLLYQYRSGKHGMCIIEYEYVYCMQILLIQIFVFKHLGPYTVEGFQCTTILFVKLNYSVRHTSHNTLRK